MAYFQVKLCVAISERFKKYIWYLKALYKCLGLLYFLYHIASTTYVDAVFVTDRCVGLSVCLFVTLVISLKTAEPIGMLFGFRNRVGAENHMLDGVQKGATLEDRRAQWKYKDFLP